MNLYIGGKPQTSYGLYACSHKNIKSLEQVQSVIFKELIFDPMFIPNSGLQVEVGMASDKSYVRKYLLIIGTN